MSLNDYLYDLRKQNLSYSQTLQDVFALLCNDYKTEGICLDLGSSGPYKHCNNTLLLQLFNWKSFSVDIEENSEDWSKFPNNKFYKKNCTSKEDMDSVFFDLPPLIDFLSLDIDGATLACLKLIDLDKYKFKCICIEHNKYLGDRGTQRFEQREILQKAGYILILKNWGTANFPYEDWYIHPNFVDYKKVQHLKDLPPFCENYDLNSFSLNHVNKINLQKKKFNKETLQLLTEDK